MRILKDLFNKKEEAPTTSPAPAAAQVAVEEPKVKANVTKETNNVLADSRYTLDKIIEKLDQMKKDSELVEEFKRITAINSAAVKQREDNIESDNKRAIDDFTTFEEILGIQKDMFLTMDDRNTYWGLINKYIIDFRNKSSIKTIQTGAHRLNKYAMYYIEGYEDALFRGLKLKAKMCNKMINYILTKGYQKENISDSDYLEKRMQHKENIVNKEGKVLLRMVDTLYGIIFEYDTMHSNKIDLQNKHNDTRARLGYIPEEVQKRIYAMEFKNAARNFPEGSDEREIYIPISMRLAALNESIDNLSLQMRHKNAEFVDHYSNFEIVFGELEKQMNVSGDIMSQEEYDKIMNDYKSRIQNDIAKMEKNVAQNKEREANFAAMIKSFEENDVTLKGASNYLDIVIRNDNNLKNLKTSTRTFQQRSEQYKKELAERLKANPIQNNIAEPEISEEEQLELADQG